MSTHYIADELWEGLTSQLGHGQGFVNDLSSFNLGHDGDGDADENPANFGGDFFVSLMMDTSGISAWKRYFPIEACIPLIPGTLQPDS